MSAPTSILLPGLDGTGKLFEPFVAAAPTSYTVRTLALPNDRPRSYRELATWVARQLPEEPVALIAESFSGPLALLVAEQCSRVAAVVLCASFIEAPLPRALLHLPKVIWNHPPPNALARLVLTGGDRALAESVRAAVASVNSAVIAARVAEALRVDVSAEFARFTRPLLFLRARQDRLIPPSGYQRARRLNPSAQFAELAAPHLLLQTRPREAWHHIEPFLEALSERH